MATAWDVSAKDRDGTSPSGDFGDTTLQEDHGIAGVFAVRVKGVGGDLESALRRWCHILSRAREGGTDKVLVVRDLCGPVFSEDDLAPLMERLVAVASLDGLRIALVQPHHDRYRIDELGSLLAMEQGADARVFPDEPSALLWLRYGDT